MLRRRLGLTHGQPPAAGMISAVVEGAIDAVEERLLWSRFGL
jgi:hypothetical protein